MTYRNSIFLGLLWLIFSVSTFAQSASPQLVEVQGIIKKEGELFMAVERTDPANGKVCLEENSYANQVQFTADSAFVNYINYTELFCEVYVLRTHYTYHFKWKDIDPAAIRLVEKKYAVGTGNLTEGRAEWFEVQIFTKDKKRLIVKRDRESKQMEYVPAVNLLVQEKESAKRMIQLLKKALQELQSTG